MGYFFTVQFGFWLRRDRLWTRNLETIVQVCSVILFGWGLLPVEAGLLFIILYVLFIYLFCFISHFFDFYTERVSVEKCSHIYFSFWESIYLFTYLFIRGRRGEVHFWYSCMLMACNWINNEILCAFTGLFSMGECISSKSNGQPLFLLEMNFTMDFRYFSSSFYHAFMLQ